MWTSGRIALATAILWLGLNSSQAEDWPQFHGPNRDNISTETGLLKT